MACRCRLGESLRGRLSLSEGHIPGSTCMNCCQQGPHARSCRRAARLGTMEIKGNVKPTAVATAYFRSVESKRPDHLFVDDLAEKFVIASGMSPDGDLRLPNVTETRLYRTNAARTHYLDEQVRQAVAAGVCQVVILGAGLDSRAFRLGLSAEVTVFEVDLESLFEFKDAAVAAAGREPTCRRITVAGDVETDDWSSALTAAGHNAAEPTVWIVESLFFYLGDEQNERLLSTISELSASGTVLCGSHFGPGSREEQQTQQMNNRATEAGSAFRSYVDDPATWLRPHGWEGEGVSIADYAATIDRHVPYTEEPGNVVAWLLSGRRL